MRSQRPHWKSPLLLFPMVSFSCRASGPSHRSKLVLFNCQTAPSPFPTLSSRFQESGSVRCSLSLCWAEALTPHGSLDMPMGELLLTGYLLLEQPCSNFLSRFRAVSHAQDRKKTTQFGILWIFTWIIYNYR